MKKIFSFVLLVMFLSVTIAEEAITYTFSVSDKYMLTSYKYKLDFQTAINACVDIINKDFRDKNLQLTNEDQDFVRFVGKYVGGSRIYNTYQDIASSFQTEVVAREIVRRYFFSKTVFDNKNDKYDVITIKNIVLRHNYFNQHLINAKNFVSVDSNEDYFYEKMSKPKSLETKDFQIASESVDFKMLVQNENKIYSKPTLVNARTVASSLKIDPVKVRQVINLSDYYTFSHYSYVTVTPIEKFKATLLFSDDSTEIYKIDISIIEKYWNKLLKYYILINEDTAIDINTSVIHENGIIYILKK